MNLPLRSHVFNSRRRGNHGNVTPGGSSVDCKLGQIFVTTPKTLGTRTDDIGCILCQHSTLKFFVVLICECYTREWILVIWHNNAQN